MENQATILVVTDNDESATYLVKQLLPQAGYQAVLAGGDAPPDVELVIVDIAKTMVAPLGGLRAERNKGVDAPALLIAPRINEEIASELFELGIRDFLTRPAVDADILGKAQNIVTTTRHLRHQEELAAQLGQQQVYLEHRLSMLDSLERIGRILTATDDVQVILERIVEAAVFLAQADESVLFMADEQKRLQLQAHKNIDPARAEGLVNLEGDSAAMQVLQSGEALMLGGTPDEQYKVQTGYLVQALICVPVVINNNVAGVLAVHNHNPNAFEEADVQAISALATYAAVGINKAQSLANLRQAVGGAAEASKRVFIHTDTMRAPVESIETLLQGLIGGEFGPLTQEQSDALHRIKLSAVRLREIKQFVDELANEYANQ